MEFSHSVYPTLPLLGVTEDERETLALLQAKGQRDRHAMELAQAYRLGCYIIDNLRIAVPKELEFLRMVLGWPAMAVDPYVERLHADSFRVSGATDADVHLSELMAANGFDSEQSIAFDDALTMGRSYWMVGTNPEPGGPPVITAESPLNMLVLWNLRGTEPRAVLQEYWDDDRKRGALLVPGKTVHLAEDDNGKWVVSGRDEHGFDFVPVVRMAHKASSNNRDGRSAITPAIQALTNAASRTLMGLEVSRERFSVPQMILMGASEAAFQNTDGTPKAAWETYITKVLALERDENGDLPEIKHAQVYDPATFTKLLDWYASAMAGEVAAPPQDLGLYTQGNPASAEAGVVSESRRDRRARNQQRQFSPALARVAQMAVRFENDGKLPEEYRTLSVDWEPVTMETPGVTSDAVTKQIAAGAVPATSDVTLKRLGYSAVERQRLAQDRRDDDGRQFARAIAAGLLPQQGASSGDADGQ